jgi:hypothetical protein
VRNYGCLVLDENRYICGFGFWGTLHEARTTETRSRYEEQGHVAKEDLAGLFGVGGGRHPTPISGARQWGFQFPAAILCGQNHLSQTSALPGRRPKTSGLLRKPCAIESSNSFLALHRGFAEYSSLANPFLFPSLMLRGCAPDAPAKLGMSTGAICKWNRCGIS